MDFYNLFVENIIVICGTVAFAISGSFAAMQKRLDAFGVLIVAFVTAVGGGTFRDVIIGDTPVFWIKDQSHGVVIILSSFLAMAFWKKLKKMKITLFLFDSLGLAVFTILGLQKGMAFGLGAGMSIALGTVTGCFGGVARDILLNNIPIIFRKEIYATACIIGGIVYFCFSALGLQQGIVELLAIAVIVAVRIIAVRKQLMLPRIY